MANTVKDLDSVISTLKESINELEAIKTQLEGKEFTKQDEDNLKSYIMNCADSVGELTGSIEDLTREASGPGQYKLEYIDKVYRIAGLTIHSEQKAKMVL